MDLRSALSEFSGLLEVASQSLDSIVSAEQSPPPELQGYLNEINGIAKGLSEMSQQIAKLI